MSSAPRLIRHYPPELTGYEVAVQAMKKIGINLSDCDRESYFLGTAWWWISCDKRAWWLNTKTGLLLESARGK